MTMVQSEIAGMSPQHMGRRLRDPVLRDEATAGKHGEIAKAMAMRIERHVGRDYTRIQRILAPLDLAIRLDPPGGNPERNRCGFGQWQFVPAISDRGFVGCVNIASGIAYETDASLPNSDLVAFKAETAIANTAQPASSSGGIPKGWRLALPGGPIPRRDPWSIPSAKIVRVIWGLSTCYRTVGTMPTVLPSGAVVEECSCAEERVGDAPQDKAEHIATLMKQYRLPAGMSWHNRYGVRATSAFGMGMWDILVTGNAVERAAGKTAYCAVMAQERQKAIDATAHEWDRCSGWQQKSQ